MAKIIVRYWRGTMRLEGKAKTYRGAMRIASRNQNAWPPTFWTPEGIRLHDDGTCLVEETEIERQTREGGPLVAYA